MAEDVNFAVTPEFQAKVLAYMIENPEFCDVAAHHLQPEHFNNKALQWFFNTIAESKHHLTPTLLREELIKAATVDKTIRTEEVSKFVSLFDVIKERVVPSEAEYITDKMSTFIKTQSVKKAIMDSVDLTKNGKWDEILSMMQDAVAAGVSLDDRGYDYFGEIESRVEDRVHRHNHKKIPTGIPELDDLTYGGIKTGQMGLIVGGTGRGKSIFLQWLARTALMLNKKVAYITFELSQMDISDRFDSMFAHVKPQELNQYQEEVIESLTKYKATYGKSLIIQHYPADTATIHTIRDFFRTISQGGLVPDLIILDYLDLMCPHRTYHSEHAEIDAITKAVVGFAAEMDVAVWTATQLNRSGMVAETPDEAGIAGYVGKLYNADMVLMMAQTKDEREDELMRLFIAKNRNGPYGRTVSLETNYSYMTFYHDTKVEEEGEDESKDTGDYESPQGQPDLQLLLKQSEQGTPSDPSPRDS